MSVLQHALCLRGRFGSAETCLKMKQLMKNENDGKHVFTFCVCIALLLPQGMFLTCS